MRNRTSPSPSPSPSPSSWMEFEALRHDALQILAALLVAASVAALGITFLESRNRRSLPFCPHHSSASASSSSSSSFLPPARAHQGSCQPCPENGICYGGELQCLPGFNKHGRVCRKDQQAQKAAKVVEDHVLQHVCGRFEFPYCKWSGHDWVSEDEGVLLVENSGIDKQLAIDPLKFRLAIEEGLKAAKKQLIVEMRISDSALELQCPMELRERYKSYFCCLQQWIAYNYAMLLATASSVFLVVKLFSWLYRKHKVSSRAEELYLQVCEALEEKAQHQSLGKETWVVNSHLRDHLLTPRERQNNSAWSMVEQMVSKDSRIDQYPRLVKGESKVVWEWQVEGRLASKQTRK